MVPFCMTNESNEQPLQIPSIITFINLSKLLPTQEHLGQLRAARGAGGGAGLAAPQGVGPGLYELLRGQ